MPTIQASISARRAEQWAKSGVSKGLSANAALSAYRQAGQKITERLWFDLYRGARGAVIQANTANKVRLDYRPSEHLMKDSLTSQLRRYSYNVQFNSTDPATNITLVRNITVSSSKLLTHQGILNGVYEALEDSEKDSADFDVDSLSIVELKKSASPLIPWEVD